MNYANLNEFLKRGTAIFAKGPIALIFAEDPVELDSTILHHLCLGFRNVVIFGGPTIEIEPHITEGPDAEKVHFVMYDLLPDGALPHAVNAVSEQMQGQWVYYCYNAEYLFFPFCETRTIGEMVTFHTEERRDAMLTYVVDLYAKDLNEHPDAVNLDEAYLDRSGYFALGRPDAMRHPKERQLDFFGGLRWRFEEYVPAPRRKIDRISIFKAKPGVALLSDYTFTDEEYNTYSCPWHHNLTAAVASFRAAKALRRNPGSAFNIHSFMWHASTKFEWDSAQLMDLGLMEPGQWF